MGFWEYGLKILFSKVLDLQYIHNIMVPTYFLPGLACSEVELWNRNYMKWASGRKMYIEASGSW